MQAVHSDLAKQIEADNIALAARRQALAAQRQAACNQMSAHHNNQTIKPSADEVATFGKRVAIRNEHTGISEVPSTRVHAAPGGKQQINIFGGMEDAPAPRPRQAPAVASTPRDQVAGGRVPTRNEYTGISDVPSTRVHAAPGDRQQINIFGGMEDAPAPQMSRKAPAPAPQDQVAGGRVPTRTEYTGISDVPSTRVHAAPGGKQSFSIFG